MVEFLCDRGIYLYENEDYASALGEFKKVLLIEPAHKTALYYIDLIREEILLREGHEELAEEIEEEVVLEKEQAIREALEEAEELMVFPAKITKEAPEYIPTPEEAEEEVILVEKIKEKEIEEEKIEREEIVVKKKPTDCFVLDEEIKASQPDTLLEIEMSKLLIIEGNQISRFLVTLPEMIAVERKTSDKIEVKPLKLGSSFLHIWDNQGRWTFKVQNIFARPEGPTLDEIQRREMEKAENFQVRYSFNRDAYYLGTKPSNLDRTSLSFSQWVGLNGETPYGKFDSSARIAKLQETTDLTYLTMGLTKAQVGPFEDFDLRGFDYNAYGSELAFPGTNLRGVRFDQRLKWLDSNYTLFWGREGRGAYGRLSPGLAEAKDSFLEGGRFFFQPFNNFDYQLAYYHGYGSERDSSLNNDSLDIIANFDTEEWKLSAQGGYDTQKFAYTLNSFFMLPGLRIATEYRNIYPGYVTIIGTPSRLGEMGGLCFLEYSGIKDLFISQRADIYRDRLYPNPEYPDMWNIELDTYASYSLGANTALNANFRYWDEKGRVSPRRERSIGAGISQSFDFLKQRDLSLYSNYQFQETKNFNSITSDYRNHRIIGGARLNLFEGLSTYISQEYSWLKEVSPEDHSYPRAWEAGIDYNQQVGKLPLYANLRASYRDEKEASSTHSFLAGEDSFELQGGLSYKPFPDWEIFVDGRIRNVWPEDLTENEVYAEGEFITGARLLFDTGFSWEPVGDIYGVVFKDLDNDGLRGKDEPGIKEVKVLLGKEKSCFSDEEGKFSFLKVRAKTAYLNLDLSSVPAGFIPSTLTMQEVSIKPDGVSTANFGLGFRCEIIGTVFVDANANAKLDADEEGLADVVLLLEDGTQAETNDKGRFYFRKVSPGKHTLSFDVNTVPIYLLPKVPIKKSLILSEGMSYIYNIPLESLE